MIRKASLQESQISPPRDVQTTLNPFKSAAKHNILYPLRLSLIWSCLIFWRNHVLNFIHKRQHVPVSFDIFDWVVAAFHATSAIAAELTHSRVQPTILWALTFPASCLTLR